MSRAALLTAYRRYYNPSLARLFDASGCPIEATGSGTMLYDEDGRGYLDFSTGHGVFAVGHAHPAVRAAVLDQLGTVSMSPPMLGSAPCVELTRRLAELLPGDLDRVVLAGSGSEAVEIALRAARMAREERRRLVAATDSYHGKTLGALAVMGQPHLRAPFGHRWPDTTFVAHGDIAAARSAVGAGALAVVVEPVIGGGTISVPPDGYLKSLRELCDATGTLLIVDEVQTGFARTGTLFAIDRERIVPDMIILSKALTGGHTPFAATVVRQRLFDDHPRLRDAYLLHTEAGRSSLACAAALATLDVIVGQDLARRAAELGERLYAGLARIAGAHPDFVLAPRGRGLMAGLQVRNHMVENALWLQLLKRGVLSALSLSMARTPVLRIYPPLIVSAAEIDQALECIDASLTEMRRFSPTIYDLANLSLRWQYWMAPLALRRGARLIG